MVDTKTFEDLFGKKEKLDPELQATIINSRGIQFLKHQLVNTIYAGEPLHAVYNNMLRVKREELRKAIAENSLETYLYTHERPFRADALLRAVSKFDLSRIGNMPEIVVEAFSDCEWPYQSRDVWLMLFLRFVRPSPLCATARRRVPPKLYRGTATEEKSHLGMSWTTDRERAVWFARRSVEFKFGRRPLLYSVKPVSDDILARYDARSECEYVLDPRGVRVNKTLRFAAA